MSLQFSPEFEARLLSLRPASRELAQKTSAEKNEILKNLAKVLQQKNNEVLEANQQDLKNLPAETPTAFRDRLTLSPARIQSLVESLLQVAALPDPVGEILEQQVLTNGLNTKKIRAPLGVILLIFEARPNVILEAFALAFKSGNAIILRGGSESQITSRKIYSLITEILRAKNWKNLPFLGIEDHSRTLVSQLLTRKDVIDVVVPRGGSALINFVQGKAQMPLIKNDRGLCHIYVEADADLEMATQIIGNAKLQRPGVCNSAETILVHRSIATKLLPLLHSRFQSHNLEWRVDPESFKILGLAKKINPAHEQDWDTEHLDLILNCKIVSDLDEALTHIAQHGSRHSEAIVTTSASQARRFENEVDAAVVYWNASTRFTDGFELGLGGELGISTQKLHVRGPVGLRELTSPRWIIEGTGQIRS